jgi:hypothetical protein
MLLRLREPMDSIPSALNILFNKLHTTKLDQLIFSQSNSLRMPFPRDWQLDSDSDLALPNFMPHTTPLCFPQTQPTISAQAREDLPLPTRRTVYLCTEIYSYCA